MNDLFRQDPPATFRDIRNVRPSSSEEKATLLLTLGKLINKCPPKIINGSVEATRSWKADRELAAKTAASSRASVNEITMAISNMRRYW